MLLGFVTLHEVTIETASQQAVLNCMYAALLLWTLHATRLHGYF
jgi:hypothetical protein